MTDQPPTQPPGWYYAQGDPPSTQRYWDGSQWQGGPQQIGQSPTATGLGGFGTSSGQPAYADHGARIVAYLIDVAIMIPAYVVALILIAIFSAISDGLGALVGVVLYLAIVGAALYNIIYLQGTTGQSFGKAKQGIKVVSISTGQPLGIGGMVIRYIVQWVFGIPCALDTFWILFDKNKQRLSDNVLGNHVIVGSSTTT